jgi:hypothetical protein
MGRGRDSIQNFRLLSELVLSDPFSDTRAETSTVSRSKKHELAFRLSQRDLEDLEALAISNHVVLRSFARLRPVLEAADEQSSADWIENSVQREKARIDHALRVLHEICSTLERDGCPVTVIKSLDHWPDLGSDLDLYTDAPPTELINVMRKRFKADLASRSWGDRLANKWNFIVPGLPELVEVHVGRLGQTGEQIAVTRSLSSRARLEQMGMYRFRVPAAEDRIVISTLQRMYRHFYVRLCDIADNARLLDAHAVDFTYLHSLGLATGLWEGIATYLTIISEYVETYRGYGVPLPSLVTESARFGTAQVRLRGDFLRVSIVPHSLNLYASELKALVLRGEFRNSLRLSLLPCLATAAVIDLKITGSDKGIW